nr:hypothetical protein [uncultured Methanobacterium sp.]
MGRKNLIFGSLALVICLFSVFIFFDLDLPPGMEPAGSDVNNVSFNKSSEEMTAYMLMLKFKTFVKGVTPLAAHNFFSVKFNWHVFGKDNSYQKGTYSQSNYYKIWADDIKRDYPLNDNRERGEAVFNYTYIEIVRKWHAHYNTACTIDEVAKYHEANCAETARIVYNLCLAVGIPKEDVQCVHSASKRHYWVQVRCDGNWTDVDPSHAEDYTYHITKFGLSKPANDLKVIPEDEVA